jgi:hypothetical protein
LVDPVDGTTSTSGPVIPASASQRCSVDVANGGASKRSGRGPVAGTSGEELKRDGRHSIDRM